MTAKSSLQGGDRLSERKQNANFEGIPHKFALWLAIVAYCILTVMGRSVTWVTKFQMSGSYMGGAVSLTIQQDMDYSDPSLITVRTIKVSTGNTSAGTVWIEATSTALGGNTQGVESSASSTPGTTTSSGFTHAKSSTVTFKRWHQAPAMAAVEEASQVYTPNGTTVTYKVTFTVPANSTTGLIRYEAYQGATLVGAFTTGPGDVATEKTLYGLPTNTVVTLKEVKVNLVIDSDGSAHFDSSTFIREVNGGTTPVQDTETATPASVTAPGATTSGGVAPTQSTTTNNYSSTVIWSSASGSAPVGGSTQIVTDSLYKEGTGKVIEAVNSVRQSVDYVKANTQTVKEFAEAQTTLRDASPTMGDMEAEAADGVASMNAALSRDAIGFGTVPTQTAPALLTLNLPVIGEISLDPATHPAIKEYLDYIKLLFGWYVILQFHWWCWDEFKKLQLATFNFRQAQGNAVMGGTGAQATGFAAAIAITVILVGIPSAYWAYATSDASSASALAANPFSSTSSIVGAALYLLALVCPYQLILILIAEMLVVRKAGVTILAGANILVKHITP